MKWAYILVAELAYSRFRVGTLLIFVAPTLPLVCVVKLAAALVLLLVSAESVVVAWNLVPASADARLNRINAPSRIERRILRTVPPKLFVAWGTT